MARYITLFLTLLLFTFCKNSQNKQAKPTKVAESTEQLAASARKSGAWLKAAKLYEKRYQADPTNEEWNYQTGTNYLKANYPQKALTILTSFAEHHKAGEFNGRIARIAKAYYQIGAYQKIEALVKNYDYPKMYRGLAREHLKALIQLNKTTDLATYLSLYKQEGIYDDKGKETNTGFLYRAICNELLIVGDSQSLKVYATEYYNWAIARQEKDKRNLAIAASYLQDSELAIKALNSAIAVEKSPRHQMELEGLLGISYAKIKESKKAKLQIEKIQDFEELPNRHDAFGAKFYHQARIEIALNQPEKAIQSLENALAAKAEFWSNRFREDGLLKELFPNEKFKELVHPKN